LEVSRRRPRRYQRAQSDRPRDRGCGDQPVRRDRPDVRARRAAAPDGHRVLDLRIFLHQRDGHRQCGDFPHLSGVQPRVRGHPQPGRERIPGSGVRAGHDHSRDRHRLDPAPPRPGRGGPRRRPEALGKGDVHAPIASRFKHPENLWQGVTLLTVAFAVNQKKMAELRLPPPHSWADLLDPKYKGHVVMSNPSTSGTAYLLLASHAARLGEDKMGQYYERLDRKPSQVTKSGGAPGRMAASGETPIGIALAYEVEVAKK